MGAGEDGIFGVGVRTGPGRIREGSSALIQRMTATRSRKTSLYAMATSIPTSRTVGILVPTAGAAHLRVGRTQGMAHAHRSQTGRPSCQCSACARYRDVISAPGKTAL